MRGGQLLRADTRRIRFPAGGVADGAAERRGALQAAERRVEVVRRRLAQLEREAGDLPAAEGADAGKRRP